MTRTHSVSALLTAMVLALVAITASPVRVHAEESDSPVAITDGSLVWGIKESWRTYIGVDGTTVEAGASTTADGLFSFPLSSGSYDPTTKTTTLVFSGSVHFTAYCNPTCLLDTRYGNLSVEISPQGQLIRGDWSGRLREDPSEPARSATGVDLAQLEIADLSPTVSDTTTTWDSIPALATEDFITYPAGTRLDPVTISYSGPGGAPTLPERWDTPGAPLYEAGATWVSDKTESNARLAYPAADGTAVIIVQGATNSADPARAHRIIAVDPVTLTPIGDEIAVPEPAFDSMLRTAFDPVAAAVYWPELSEVTATDGTASKVVAVHRAAWDSTAQKWTTSVIGELPSTAYSFDRIQISSMLWNRQTQQLAVISGAYSLDAPETTLTLFSPEPSTDSWTPAHYPLDLPTELRERYRSSQLSIPFGLSGTTQNLALLPDGSYLLAGGGTARETAADGTVTSTPVPALRLQLNSDRVEVSAVAGSEPADLNSGAGHGFASVTGDGTVLLSSSLGAFRPVSLTGDQLSVGEEFTFNLNGNIFSSPVVAADPVTGLTITTNTSAKKLLFFRGSHLIGSQDAPLVNGILPTSVTVGVDGSLYLQSRTAEGFGAISRMALVGTVPDITQQPRDVTITHHRATSKATFWVSATGSPQPSIQWQRRSAGSDQFVDLEGRTGSRLTVRVGTADDGAEFRAVVSSAAGRIASEPATLSVRR